MLDPALPRNALIAAALRLAAGRPWADVTLADIAEAAGTTLSALKKEFASKGEIIAAFTSEVDDEVLVRAPKRTPDQPVRDTLFEVIMCRFDVLAPYRPALRSIVQNGLPDPAHVRPVLESQRWMLEAAGVNTAGLEGGFKVAGLATVYGSVFRVWLADEDPGQARTMAALDRRLRRGERTLTRIDEICSGLTKFISAAMPRGFKSSPRATDDAGAGATSAGTPPTGAGI
ncbi:MAG: TetR family transcriptional regulator [Hyphomicrobiaceae bacterium]